MRTAASRCSARGRSRRATAAGAEVVRAAATATTSPRSPGCSACGRGSPATRSCSTARSPSPPTARRPSRATCAPARATPEDAIAVGADLDARDGRRDALAAGRAARRDPLLAAGARPRARRAPRRVAGGGPAALRGGRDDAGRAAQLTWVRSRDGLRARAAVRRLRHAGGRTGGRVLELAQMAELAGLDLVTFQDHPYKARFLDTWTLLSVVAAQTDRRSASRPTSPTCRCGSPSCSPAASRAWTC